MAVDHGRVLFPPSLPKPAATASVQTPDDGAIKWWIGNAAEDGKAATVFARLKVGRHSLQQAPSTLHATSTALAWLLSRPAPAKPISGAHLHHECYPPTPPLASPGALP